MRRGPVDGELEVFLCLRWLVKMEVMPKPSCYDSVPPCLCSNCQRYDVFMASCIPRTFGKTTSGLAVVNASRSSFADAHARSVRSKPARSRPRASCADPVVPPVVSSAAIVSVCSSPVAVRSSSASSGSCARSSPVAVSAAVPSLDPVVTPVVSSSAPFGSRARSSPVAVSSAVPISVAVSSVSCSLSAPVVSRPVSFGSLARSVSVSPVRPSPVVVPSTKSGPAGPGSTVVSSVRSVPVSTVRSAPSVWPRSVPRLVRPYAQFGRPASFLFVPVVCLVLAVPVLLSSPFGFVWTFLPVWR